MRQFAARASEFADRDVAIVRVFYSPVKALAWALEDGPPLPFPVLGDPDRVAYGRYGVEKSLGGLFRRSAYGRVKQSRDAHLKPHWRDAIRDGFTGLPADFLIGPDGTVLRVHYGEHFTDSLPVDAALQWCDEIGTTDRP